jgi:hypothetical protein
MNSDREGCGGPTSPPAVPGAALAASSLGLPKHLGDLVGLLGLATRGMTASPRQFEIGVNATIAFVRSVGTEGSIKRFGERRCVSAGARAGPPTRPRKFAPLRQSPLGCCRARLFLKYLAILSHKVGHLYNFVRSVIYLSCPASTSLSIA